MDETSVNFTFEAEDIVSIRSLAGEWVLIKGFDPIVNGFRIWWADPLVNGVADPNKRVRTYTNKMVRLRRPKEEAALAKRAKEFNMRKILVKFRQRAEASEAELRRLRKKGKFCLQTGPVNVPPGKWLTEDGIQQVREALKIKPRNKGV